MTEETTMKKVTIDAFYGYRFLSRVMLTEDGESAVFVQKKPDPEENGYESHLMKIRLSDGKVTQLTGGGKEGNYIFDGPDTLLFSANRGKKDEAEEHKDKTVFYRLPLDGGEALRAFELPFDVGMIKRIREGLYVFTANIDTNKPDIDKADKDYLKDYDDYHIIEELPYWTNGGGFISRFRDSLFLFDEKENKTTKLTRTLQNVSAVAISGTKVVYEAAEYDAVALVKPGLYIYDPESGETKTVFEQDRYYMHGLAATETGFYYGLTDGAVYDDHQTGDLYFYDGEKSRLLCDKMPAIGGLNCDAVLGGGESFFTRGERLYFKALERFEVKLKTISREKPEIEEIFGDFPVQAFDVKGGRMVMAGMEKGALQELYKADLAAGTVEKLTHLNEGALEDVSVSECIYLPYTNSDGVEIDGWIMEPYDYDETKRYPGILNIHGGPRGAYGDVFFHEMQYWASEGYFVFFCNPRGSDGRGDAFADIRKKFGTVDYRDIMEFVDHVIEETPALDPERIGVTGGSYGGWMTNWIIGHTNRFKAAASQRSFSNWLSDFSASEIGVMFDVSEIGATPWEEPERLWWASPAAYVDKVETPTLFIHSLMDHNCPLSEAMQMFAGIRYRGIPARMCLFEGESHELSRSGKPRHRVRRIREITEWMDRYLKTEDEKKAEEAADKEKVKEES